MLLSVLPISNGFDGFSRARRAQGQATKTWSSGKDKKGLKCLL
jgi:hypothetical protein